MSSVEQKIGWAGGSLLLTGRRLLMLVLVALVTLGGVNRLEAVTQTKKHKSSKSPWNSNSPKFSSSKKGHAKYHARVHHWLPGPRVNAARRVALVKEIGASLNDPGTSALSNEKALRGFFAALNERASGTSTDSTTQTLRVLQFGDSHTAADVFSGEARRILQEKFGNGGVGYVFAGHPFAGFRVFGSSHSASNGWSTMGNHFTELGDGRTGLGGLSISTDRANESVTLDAPCTTLELEYLAQPGGGSLQFTDNGTPMAEINTDAETVGAGSFNYQCPVGDHHFALKTEANQPVTLLGWIATQPGVTWECLGINGAEAPLMLKWDQALFSEYLKSNDPALIVLAYGTNEAASSSWDEASYAESFARLVDQLHQYVPDASILVIGPSDRSTVVHRSWKPFEATEKIIAAQQKVCEKHNCAFWDQRERMGGLGSMQDWVYAGWAQSDHTHFTSDGYRALADAFMLDLLNGYKDYKDHAASRNVESAGADTIEGRNDGRERKNIEGAHSGLRQGTQSR